MTDQMILSVVYRPAEPLRDRVPTFDEDGRALSDFMVLIPGLADRPEFLLRSTIRNIQIILNRYSTVVVFSELNVKLSLLWVSVKPEAGTSHRLTSALRAVIPEARLITHL